MMIKPIRDLRNTNEISDLAHQTQEPIYITKNGYGDLVVLAIEAYQKQQKKKSTTFPVPDVSFHQKEQLHRYGFVNVSAHSLPVRIGNVDFHIDAICKRLTEEVKKGSHLVVFPELCLTGYTCNDLFFQSSLQEHVIKGLQKLKIASAAWKCFFVVGAPFYFENACYNCAFCFYEGKLLGISPKTYLPNHSEFAEKRYFHPAPIENRMIDFLDESVPFGSHLLFQNIHCSSHCIGIEICEDAWAPIPIASEHALAGATIVCNLSASNEWIGKAKEREVMLQNTSKRNLLAYVYASASPEESTTDLLFSGVIALYENGVCLAKDELSVASVHSTIDTQYIESERTVNQSFHHSSDDRYWKIPFAQPLNITTLHQQIEDSPFLEKENPLEVYERTLLLQALGLKKRLEHTHIQTIVLGLSGGIDSTIAFLVALKTCALMNWDATHLHALSLPCFGTSKRTYQNARQLCDKTGVLFQEISIREAVEQHLKDISHQQHNFDVTFENAQARERTQILMDHANKVNGLVIGTGDLSEIALGWSTYNGDHMSMYAVNASLPKTYLQAMLHAFSAVPSPIQSVLKDIVLTPISPELLPLDNQAISQLTEEIVGPYCLHDFFLYHLILRHASFSKIFFLAQIAFQETYNKETIRHWLLFFIRRFFQQQFKRSCSPDGVKVGPISLSPRGNFRLPSDVEIESFLQEIRSL